MDTFNTKLYTVREVAEQLRMSVSSARRIVVREPGVLHICVEAKPGRAKREKHLTPEPVFRRIYRRYAA